MFCEVAKSKSEAVEQQWCERVRDVIMHTLKLANKGRIEQAFVVLDSAIAEPGHEHKGEGALLLRLITSTINPHV